MCLYSVVVESTLDSSQCPGNPSGDAAFGESRNIHPVTSQLQATAQEEDEAILLALISIFVLITFVLKLKSYL